MKEYRDQVHTHMRAFGRDPATCKILFMAVPVLGETEAHALERADRRATWAASHLDQCMAQIGWTTNIDFSGHDLDAPLQELTTNGHQSSLTNFIRKAGGKTLREAVIAHSSAGGSIDFVGTPDAIAGQMAEVMQEVGGDGFLITLGNASRRSVAEITDGLVPALQQRGLVRKQYAHQTFRDNLLEF